MIKWAVPVHYHDFHCVIVSEGILARKQWEEADIWADYLSKEYHINRDMIYENYRKNKTMNENQMTSSIQLLKDLLRYHLDAWEDVSEA